ncbi:methyltransferase [Sinorhizobium medicae]|nr:methyltransferase [Sinorhizobium medicae]
MAKLTKAQAKAHQQACDLLKKDSLSDDDKEFVLRNWQESATNINTVAGAFFTPLELAMDFAIEAHEGRIIDLCAGIGMLSYAATMRNVYNTVPLEITCVEINPEYVEVGKKILPEATWINASVFDVLDMDLGRFDFAISNPPFGAVKRPDGKKAPRYTGADFEFHVIDIASHIADHGVFLVPRMSAGFDYSGRQGYARQKSGKAFDFQNKTGLYFEPGCGVDTAIYRNQWRGVSPICEIVCIDFLRTEEKSCALRVDQFDLFGDAA